MFWQTREPVVWSETHPWCACTFRESMSVSVSAEWMGLVRPRAPGEKLVGARRRRAPNRAHLASTDARAGSSEPSTNHMPRYQARSGSPYSQARYERYAPVTIRAAIAAIFSGHRTTKGRMTWYGGDDALTRTVAGPYRFTRPVVSTSSSQ